MFGVNVKLNKTGQLSVYPLIPFKEIPDELLIFVSNNGDGVYVKDEFGRSFIKEILRRSKELLIVPCRREGE